MKNIKIFLLIIAGWIALSCTSCSVEEETKRKNMDSSQAKTQEECIETNAPPLKPTFSAKKRKIFEAFKNAKGEDRYKKGVATEKMLRKHIDEFCSRRESNENRLLTKQEVAFFLGRPGKKGSINSNRELYSYDLNPESPLIDTALLIIEFEDNEIINVSIAKSTD